MSTFKIENLHVSIGEKKLKGIDLVVNTRNPCDYGAKW